jgi:hypothetical protein
MMTMKLSVLLIVGASFGTHQADSFSICPNNKGVYHQPFASTTVLGAGAKIDETDLTPEQKEQVVGNLVADDEWEGLGIELTELVRVSVLEDMKKNARDFLGKDEYKVRHLSINFILKTM